MSEWRSCITPRSTRRCRVSGRRSTRSWAATCWPRRWIAPGPPSRCTGTPIEASRRVSLPVVSRSATSPSPSSGGPTTCTASKMAALSANVLEPQDAARAAGWRYVSDAAPGIRRRRAGRGFAYVGPGGGRISDPDDIARIKSLAVPPAWTDVWICADPRGHIQATGRDARGRKQYRYHAVWRQCRDESKYDRMIAFGEALPSIRQQVAADLSQHGLPRQKVLAAVVRLLDGTLVRIGNPEYARENGSYGLSTMRDDHVNVLDRKSTRLNSS